MYSSVFAYGKDEGGHELFYWFARPATSWENESLPIGNGSVGANVFGTISEEHITLNETCRFGERIVCTGRF